MVLRLHGEALFQEARSGPQIHECVVHLLAAGYVRYAITDLDRLVNHIAAAFAAFWLLLALAGIAPSRLSCLPRRAKRKRSRKRCCIRSQFGTHGVPLHLKNTLLALDPWIAAWHIVHAWYLVD